MGTDSPEGFPEDGEGPSREVAVASFRIAATAVTNAQFREFVKATGYITEAEQVGVSFVFYLQVEQALRDLIRQVPSGLPWWLSIEGACWQRPTGPGSNIYDRLDHPVVQVSWNDAIAYCQWRNCRLPSEAQWELAARGGLGHSRYAWGEELYPKGQMQCQIWQGEFPNLPAPGWSPGTVAVDRFAPNGFGLFNTAGNVWEMVSGLVQSRLPSGYGAGKSSLRSTNRPAFNAWRFRSCVTTLTAIVIVLQLARRTRRRVRRAISDSGSQPTADQRRC